MGNNKQSSIEWLLDRIEDVDLTPQIWEKIKQQAKAMHKEEIIKFAETYEDYCHNSFTQNRYVQVKSAEQYYNETYGGNK